MPKQRRCSPILKQRIVPDSIVYSDSLPTQEGTQRYLFFI